MRNDDAEELRVMLEDRIEAVLDSLAPGWMKKGSTAYLTPKSKKDLGSFTVSLDSHNRLPRGSWYRFSQAVGGGSVELVSYLRSGRKDDYRNAFEWTRDFFGIRRSSESEESKQEREDRLAASAAEREEQNRARDLEQSQKKAERIQSANEVWNEGQPLAGSHAEAYLIERGLPPVSEWPWDCRDVLRFHPSLSSELQPRAGRFPALIGNVQDAFDDTISVWQIFLDRTKPIKCPMLDNPKVGRGPAGGGAVRIGGIAPHIGVGEGFETSIAAWALERYRYPVWATLSTSGMAGFEPPMEIKRITIWPDGDWAVLSPNGAILEPPGIHAARSLQSRMKPTGMPCGINDTTQDGDALDMYVTMKRIEARMGAKHE